MVEKLYVSYKDKAEFFLVYISEAHANLLKKGEKKPENTEERAILASKCLENCKLTMPAVIDGMDGKVEKMYAGWPDRFCVVDLDGKVAYYSGRGPWGFKPDETEKYLKELLAGSGRITPSVYDDYGDAVDGLRCSFGLNLDSIEEGKPIVSVVRIKNVSKKAISFNDVPIYRGNDVSMKDAEGVDIQRRNMVNYYKPEQASRKITIEPGKVYEIMIKGELGKIEYEAKDVIFKTVDVELKLPVGKELTACWSKEITIMGEKPKTVKLKSKPLTFVVE
ncbi:MAG: hypothetical protein JEZ07_11680 [Phycisphaerae bacterium]|nr:hypothetical protein [Phycisphaerae bacterium]